MRSRAYHALQITLATLAIITVHGQPANQPEEECSGALGMQNGTITDAHITASSNYNAVTAAANARFNKTDGAWQAAYNDRHSYLRVDLRSSHRLTALALQGGGAAINGWVKNFKIIYSLDGYRWTFYKSGYIFEGNSARYHSIRHTIEPPILTRYVAIVPTSFYHRPTLRVELFGCRTEIANLHVTTVTENITTNTFWDFNSSPYIVHNNLKVTYAATLTIQAGVEVIFTNDHPPRSAFIVEGCLQVEGLPGLVVKFRPGSLQSYLRSDVRYWAGIQTINTAGACTENTFRHLYISGAETALYTTMPHVLLQWIRIEHCTYAINAVNVDTLRIENSHIANNPRSGMEVRVSGNTSFINTTFENNGVNVRLWKIGDQISLIAIDSCRFIGGNYGFMGYSLRHFIVKKSYFDNYRTGVNIEGTSYDLKISVKSSVFNMTGGYRYRNGMRLVTRSRVKSELIIVDTTCHHGHTGFLLQPNNRYFTFIFDNITMVGQTSESLHLYGSHDRVSIVNSTFNNSKNAIKMNNEKDYSDISVTNNTFFHNSGTNVISIVRVTSRGNATITINNNTFIDNIVPSVYIKDNMPGFARCEHNIFDNPASVVDLEVGSPWPVGYTVDARYNWWGTANTSMVERRVRDFFTNVGRCEALLSPVYTDDSLTASVPLSRAYSKQGDTVGGRIENDMELLLNNVTVTTTIHIVRDTKVIMYVSGYMLFQDTAGIVVEGTLELRGTGGNSAVLTANTGNKWGGIRLVNSNASSIQHCILSHATTAVDVKHSSLSLSNVEIRDCNKGIEGTSAVPFALHLADVTVRRSGAAGIRLQTSSPGVGPLSLYMERCLVEGNGGEGVYVRSHNVRLDITDSKINTNTRQQVYVVSNAGSVSIASSRLVAERGRQYYNLYDMAQINSRYGSPTLSIKNSYFRTSGNACIRVYNYYGQLDVTLRNNSLSSQRGPSVNIESARTTGSVVHLENCRLDCVAGFAAHFRLAAPQSLSIKDNFFFDSLGALSILISGKGRNDAMSISGNKFLKMITKPTIHLSLKTYASTSEIRNNSFVNSTATAILIDSSYAVSVLDNFFDNLGEFDLKVTSLFEESHILYAERNWWGSSDFGSVSKRIFDNSKQSTLIKVDFLPFLTGRNLSMLSKPDDGFYRGDTKIGGTLTQDIVLTKRVNPYIVVQDIIIPRGLSLTIEAGTQVSFQQGGISIAGQLQVQGSRMNKIILAPAFGVSSWKGISFVRPWSELVRLSGGTTSREGQVNIFLQGRWSPVCGHRWNIQAADILCRQLGFNRGVANLIDDDRFRKNANTTGEWTVICTGKEHDLMDCQHQKSCHYSYRYRNAAVICKPNVAAETSVTGLLKTSDGDLNIAYDSTMRMTVGGTETPFHLIRPGLTGQANTVSLMSFKKPGWFVRHYNSELVLDPRSNPQDPAMFKADATFRQHNNNGYLSFEAVNKAGYYIMTSNDSYLVISTTDNSTEQQRKTKFVVVEAASRDKRSVTGEEPVASIDEEVFDKSDSVLSHVVVLNTSEGITVRGKPPLLRDVKVMNALSSGLSYRGYLHGVYTVDSCEFVANQVHGIFFSSAKFSHSTNVTIRGCLMQSNKKSGIYLSASINYTVFNSTIEQSGEYGILLNRLQETKIEILQNVINKNRPAALRSQQSNSLKFIFANNTLADNYLHINTAVSTIHFDSVGRHDIQILNNHFVNNLAAREYYSWGRRLIAANTLFIGSGSEVRIKISDNDFENGTGQSVLHFNQRLGSCISCIVEDNIFVNNTPLSTNDVMTTIILQYDQNIAVRGNLFANPKANYELRLPNFQDGILLNASHNYWNVPLHSDAIARVDCFYNNMELGRVTLWPLYTSSNATDSLNFPPADYGFSSSTNGGEVVHNITLKAEDSPHIIKRSIFLREGASLIMESGVTIQFALGRGMRVRGNLSMRGTKEKLIVLRGIEGRQWFGVIVEKISKSAAFRFLNLSTTVKGFQLFPTNVQLEMVTMNATEQGVLIYGGGQIDIRNCTFERNSNALQFYGKDASINITDSRFVANRFGIRARAWRSVAIRRSIFVNHTARAIMLDGTSNPVSMLIDECEFNNDQQSALYINIGRGKSMNITNNRFKRCGVNYCLQITTQISTLLIANNQFQYSSTAAIYPSGPRTLHRQYFITGNAFRNTRKIPVSVQYCENTFFVIENNQFVQNTVDKGASGLLFRCNRPRGLIRWNNFTENKGESVVEITGNRVAATDVIDLYGNVFYLNSASSAVISSQLPQCNTTYNLFGNPSSRFDLAVTFSLPSVLNATNNWWGSKDADFVANRIKNNDGRVMYKPFLLSPEISCSDVNNCSEHGVCVKPQTCECHSGWKGRECAQHSCRQLNECQGRGECIGPNVCRCREGWLPPNCAYATCYGANNCSGHGLCISPDVCHCADHFHGVHCDRCTPDHWGPNCLPCPACDHGSCDLSTGECVCESRNWAGSLCDRCSEKFYGVRCEPLIRVLQIAPNRGPDVGGTLAHVLGHNFIEPINASDYRCKFGRELTPGRWVSEEEIRCTTPAHAATTVVVEISPEPGKPFTNDKMTFTFYAICPVSACGSDRRPARGVCSMAQCLCRKPWTGADCDILGVKPAVTRVLSRHAMEGEPVQLHLTISEGTTPIDWSLSLAPPGATLASQRSVITWVAIARALPWHFAIRATNEFGSGSMQFDISVMPSYTASVDQLPRGPFRSSVSVLISGKVHFVESDSPLDGKSVPVKIIINSKIGKRIMMTNTLPGTNVFYKRFYPSSLETGLFEVDANHPIDESFHAQTHWTVYGLRVTASAASLAGYLGVHSVNVTVTNSGADLLTRLVMQRVNVPFEMILNGEDPCQLNLHDCPITSRLNANDELRVEITIVAKLPARGYFRLLAFAQEGVDKFISVRFAFQAKLPILVSSLSRIDSTVTRGKRYTYIADISNAGLRPATAVHIELPSEPMIALVSFATASRQSDDTRFTLLPGQNATLVLSVTVPQRETLGRRSGSMVIRSLETAFRLTYSFVVASSAELNLTVKVEDEYTYFADDKPLLKGATVTLRSRLRDVTLSQVTGESGTVVFTGLQEDYYSLYTRADRHIGDSRVILATPSADTVRVFIQRTAVTYSWVVRRVTYEDRYDITLEADFETNVPIPVVTIKPQELDLDILQRGLMPLINFELTNHGLIRADNVNFKLPDVSSHPFIHLEMDMEKIGSLAANTTIQVPVRVVVDEKKKQQFIGQYPGFIAKRSNPLACLALAIYAGYTYLCDRERFNRLSVPIKNGLSRHCGGGGGRVSGGGGYWTGYSSYSSGGPSSRGGGIAITQPLTCDEVINCLKASYRCYKAVKPVIDCLKSLRAIGIPYIGPLYVIFKCYKAYKSIKRCRKEIKKCKGSGGGGGSRRKRSIASQDDLAPELASRLLAATNEVELAEVVANDPIWFEADSGDWWNLAVQPMLADKSDLGLLISEKEFDKIHTFPLPTNITREMSDTLIHRLNNSYYNWDNGILEGENMISYARYSSLEKQIKADKKKVNEAGYESMSDWYNEGLDKFEKAEQKSDDGVCAKVRIRIQQRLALTRDAFKATLELENGETAKLTAIRVVLHIDNHQTKASALQHFAIGAVEVSGMGGVDGDGSLDVKQTGRADWLIIPYSAAAPTADTQYDIAGTLYYSVNGQNITVPLFPDTITVKPDPRLYLNYFLEKYVKGDDPLTEDVVEPTVPFSLAILITNAGYGSANNLRITSGQPEIIDNEKGLLVSFKIIGAQLGSRPVSRSLTLTFGDIRPQTTAVARWLMTSSLKGTFSNYTATFENTNPLGDPQLSIMESVLFHELLHVVQIDFPQDDGLPDFLVLSETKLDDVPDRIFTSSDGRNPLNVSVTNIIKIVQSGTGVMQVTVLPTNAGWVYFRGIYKNEQKVQPTSATRSDNQRSINVQHNIWIDDLNDESYLQILDYVEHPNTELTYNIFFSMLNSYKPEFSQLQYVASVEETDATGYEVIVVQASDKDSDQSVTYSIESSYDTIELPFSIDKTSGSLRAVRALDRETADIYTLSIVATDNGTPPRQSAVPVQISVRDVNDNKPQFADNAVSVSVEEDIEVGYLLTVVSATDLDAGINGTVSIRLLNDSTLFTYYANGSLMVTSPLIGMIGRYQLLFEASDEGLDRQISKLVFRVNVMAKNRFAPVFQKQNYIIVVNESIDTGTTIVRVAAVDRDNGTITYDIVSLPGLTVPFKISSLGDVITVEKLDREKRATYTFDVISADNGAQPTGPKTATANVIIKVTDVNDNAPKFESNDFTAAVLENVAIGSEVIRIRAVDIDDNENGEIARFSISPSSDEVPFRLQTLENNGECALFTTESLDAESRSRYTVTLTAQDNGTPPLSASVTINIVLTDVNDNSPVFASSLETIFVSRSAVPNSRVFTALATDADISEKHSTVEYTLLAADDAKYLRVSRDTGVVRLARALPPAPRDSLRVEVSASSGARTARQTLVVDIVDTNRFAPQLSAAQYWLAVNESQPSSAALLQLTATDDDSSSLSFEILSGNDANVFALDPFSGLLSLAGQLDREAVSSYNLVVAVFDAGVGGGVGVLNSTADIHIDVLDTNEFTPQFVNGVVYQVSIVEETIRPMLFQMKTSDGDGQNVSYAISHDDGLQFSIDSATGIIKQIAVIDREKEQQIRFEVQATDDGIPPRSSVAEVFVSVEDINDNAPVFAHDLYRVYVNTTSQRSMIFTAVADDADAGSNARLRYSLAQGEQQYFTLDEISGEIYMTSEAAGGQHELRVTATDGGEPALSAEMTLYVTVTDMTTEEQTTVKNVTDVTTEGGTTVKTSPAPATHDAFTALVVISALAMAHFM